jgi:pimeloyl-ACP methyl ester carboxylesterase
MGFLYFMQTALIFPGRESQGQSWAVVTTPPGIELVPLRTADGERVVALFGGALTADGRPRDDAATRPTILFFYGNGDCLRGASGTLFDGLRRAGANVCIPEYVGYGMSSGSPSERDCYATADAAYDYLLTREDVNPASILVAGWSLGAAVAGDLAARRPATGLAMFSSFTSMGDMAREVYPFIPGARLLLSHRFENEEKIARISCPILLGHGTADTIIPYAMSERLAAAAGGPVTLVAVEGAGHNDFFAVGGRKVFGAIGELVDGR